ncbi:MAG: ankyrin repeat domain-containing protein [Fimbriiglobus sp.]
MEPLLEAVLTGNHHEVARLVEGGADINARCDEGASVLFAASLSGDVEMVRLLLDLGADPNLVAEEPAASIYCPKVVDLISQAQFLTDWAKYTPVLELLLARGATDDRGQVPTFDFESRKRLWLENQGRQPVRRPWWRFW